MIVIHLLYNLLKHPESLNLHTNVFINKNTLGTKNGVGQILILHVKNTTIFYTMYLSTLLFNYSSAKGVNTISLQPASKITFLSLSGSEGIITTTGHFPNNFDNPNTIKFRYINVRKDHIRTP